MDIDSSEVAGGYWNDEEKRTLDTLFRFVTHLAAYRSWSQMQFSMMLPQALACVHHESVDVRVRGLQRIRGIVEAILVVEDAVYNNNPPIPKKHLKTRVLRLLKDLSWNSLQLARECMAACQQCDFDSGNEELRLLTFLIFGRMANTKFFLEDVFNHVADISRRHAKNHTMQKWFVLIGACFSWGL